jgi:hypothetical protein
MYKPVVGIEAGMIDREMDYFKCRSVDPGEKWTGMMVDVCCKVVECEAER